MAYREESMTDIEKKKTIQKAIGSFADSSPTDAGLALFSSLGYSTKRRTSLREPTPSCFVDTYTSATDRFSEKRASLEEWTYADLLFQLTKEELRTQGLLFDNNRVDDTIMESYLFFAIKLREAHYSRTKLAKITREVNKLFPMPVMVLFVHGESISISIIDRRLNKKMTCRMSLRRK